MIYQDESIIIIKYFENKAKVFWMPNDKYIVKHKRILFRQLLKKYILNSIRSNTLLATLALVLLYH